MKNLLFNNILLSKIRVIFSKTISKSKLYSYSWVVILYTFKIKIGCWNTGNDWCFKLGSFWKLFSNFVPIWDSWLDVWCTFPNKSFKVPFSTTPSHTVIQVIGFLTKCWPIFLAPLGDWKILYLPQYCRFSWYMIYVLGPNAAEQPIF